MPLFADNGLMPVVLVAIAAMIVAWVVFRTRHAARGGKRSRGANAGNAERTGNQSPPQQLDRWEVQMHETARELSAQLDTKMSALQALIRSAKEEQAKLQELIDRAEQL